MVLCTGSALYLLLLLLLQVLLQLLRIADVLLKTILLCLRGLYV